MARGRDATHVMRPGVPPCAVAGATPISFAQPRLLPPSFLTRPPWLNAYLAASKRRLPTPTSSTTWTVPPPHCPAARAPWDLGPITRSTDVLDEFAATSVTAGEAPSAASVPATAASAALAESGPAPAADDAFAKELESGMAELLREISANPDLEKQFDHLVHEFGAAMPDGPAPAAAPAPQPSASSAASDAASPAAKAAEQSFQDTIRRTMERMQESGDQATAATTDPAASEDELMAQMLKELGEDQADGAGGGGGGDDDLSKLLLGVMEQLTNKDILYEPMQELCAKFPAWLVQHCDDTPAADLARYEDQHALAREMVARFEQPGYADANAADREYIVERMHKVRRRRAHTGTRRAKTMLDAGRGRAAGRPRRPLECRTGRPRRPRRRLSATMTPLPVPPVAYKIPPPVLSTGGPSPFVFMPPAARLAVRPSPPMCPWHLRRQEPRQPGAPASPRTPGRNRRYRCQSARRRPAVGGRCSPAAPWPRRAPRGRAPRAPGVHRPRLRRCTSRVATTTLRRLGTRTGPRQCRRTTVGSSRARRAPLRRHGRLHLLQRALPRWRHPAPTVGGCPHTRGVVSKHQARSQSLQFRKQRGTPAPYLVAARRPPAVVAPLLHLAKEYVAAPLLRGLAAL